MNMLTDKAPTVQAFREKSMAENDWNRVTEPIQQAETLPLVSWVKRERGRKKDLLKEEWKIFLL